MTHFWLRSEIKPQERRTLLTPENAKILIQNGCHVSVEKCCMRIFKNEEYQAQGCSMVEAHSWREAPREAIILALKELPKENSPLSHSHIFFAHCYKGQEGAQELADRFRRGGGKILDLEYLYQENGKRAAAFGYWAGFVGSGLGVALQADHFELKSFENKKEFIDFCLSKNQSPSAIIIGALGRCGQGAQDALNELGITPTCWDYEETKNGGPFKEILNYELFINAALITKKIPPFIDKNLLSQNSKLKVIADISCDPTSDLNPIPLYDKITSWDQPTHPYNDQLKILAIDNLPSVLPRESSVEFSNALLPYLLELKDGLEGSKAWMKCLSYFTQFLKSSQ